MELKLQRNPSTDKSTIGDLAVDGAHQCFTLEDPVRAVKIPGSTAIAAGRYPIELAWSSKFKCLMFHLIGVPDFNGILIHAGNTPEDTEGCLLVGRSYGPDEVYESVLALWALSMKMLTAMLGGQGVWITIQNAATEGKPS